jgi:hypothetical protein
MSSEAPKKRGRKPGSTNKPTGPVGSRASSVRRNVTLDDYPAIQVEGGLFTVEHVRKVAKTDADKQSPADYDLPAGIDLKEEIGRSFRIATALWKDFDSARQGEGDKTQATARFVSQLLKDCFGFSDIKTTEPKVIAEIPYPIGRTAHGKAVPILIVGAHQGLDIADLALGDGHRKRTASQLSQEYLNAEDTCLWAVCTNGLVIRLLRDSDSLTRQSYFEANLERILGEQLMADFAMLWLHAHASRFKPDATGPAGCPLEIWHLAAQEEGSRVRDSLRIGVEKAMVELGSGFLEHRDGARLREALRAGTLKLEEYHQQVLRLVYRMLFLFAVEDRKILHPRAAKTEQVELYAEGYSLSRLRERSIKHCHDRYDDIWDSLKVTFRGLATGQEALGLPPLGSLFAEEQCVELVRSNISNRRLLNAIRAIAWFRENDALVPVNYKSMGTEELGSVYESLLELTPAIDESGKGFGFIKADEEEGKGNSRKTSGSYYTPDSLVQQLLDTTLDPVVADRLKGKSTKEEKEKAILSITVIDPACGSGHFLLGAARRLAEKLASIRAEGGEATDYRRALRDIIAHCIHGVDRNPMAIQLAKVALWLEGYVADKPLSFLDHHLVVGDSILSIIDLDMATKGIPDEAYEAITGDDKATARALKARNKSARDSELKVKQGTMDLFGGTKVDMGKSFAKIDVLADDTLDAVAKKVGQLEIFMKEAQADWRVAAAKLYLGAYLLPKTSGSRAPTSSDILAVMNGESLQDVMPAVDTACMDARILVWPLAFPHVFEKGGFDVVLGNPPWERLTLKEKEFFAVRSPKVANARNKAERQKEIDLLEESPAGSADRKIYQEFLEAKRVSEVSSSFAHDVLRFPLTGQGDVNLYALFAENFLSLISDKGRAGFLAPTGVATDRSTSRYFSHLLERKLVSSLYDFENKKGLFKGVHKSFKFCLLTVGFEPLPKFAFMLHDVNDLRDARRVLTLTASQMAKLNPNTKNAPIIRSQKDAEIISGIYNRLPVFLLDEAAGTSGSNPWKARFVNQFHSSGDSDLFSRRRAAGLEPVYESKMIHIYDHRWNNAGEDDESADGSEENGVSIEQKKDTGFSVNPRYWVSAIEVSRNITFLPRELIKELDSQDVGADLAVARVVCAARMSLGEVDHEAFLRGIPWMSLPAGALVGVSGSDAIVIPKLVANKILSSLESCKSLNEARVAILLSSRPNWLLGWRKITRTTDRRTIIASAFPAVGSTDSLYLVRTAFSADLASCLMAQWLSLVADYVCRNKLGGTNLSYGYFNQLPVVGPDGFKNSDLMFLVPRILELVYTAHDVVGFYDDVISCNVAYDARVGSERGKPYGFDVDRRLLLKCEVDAYIAHMWGLSRDELRFVLDPKEVMGSDYPSETFRGIRDAEIKEFGEYRTRRLVLEAWDRIVEPLRSRQA